MTPESAEQASANMLRCSHCSKEFKYNSERNRHELSHSPRFNCEVCCKKFSFVSALRRHQKQHERTGSVKCEVCSRKFRDEVLLKRHIKYAHKGTFTCTKCSTQFSSDQALLTHMKTHKPETERRFKCSFDGCGKAFNFSHHLKHHELTHTNTKQHYCSVCGKGFIQSHHLKTHIKTHNPSEWLHCEVSRCKKKFSTEYARKRHMATHNIKIDSGISSDSSSCDASISSKECAEDFILCASCGESVSQTDYAKHSTECGDTLEISDKMKSSTSLVKQEVCEETLQIPKHNMLDKYLGDCQSALGSCIMNANNCLCAQMSKTIENNYDFSPIGNPDCDTNENNNNIYFKNEYYDSHLEGSDSNNVEPNPNITKYDNTISVLNRIDSVMDSVGERTNIGTYFSSNNSQNSVRNLCEGCECASSCNIKDPSNCNLNINRDTDTNVELRVDGVIKIKDTFDIDIPIKVESKKIKQSHFIPFSTCRDVIGNCIVGGNEGCLCARMMMDDQQAMAQEIDDITPKPKTEL